MALGALLLSPLGDIVGRRAAIMGCLIVISAGTLLTAATVDPLTMSACRFLTGLGIGAMVSNIGTIVLETVPPARRTACLGFVLVGTPVGALVGGSVALFLLDTAGWEGVFICGGVLTAAMIPAVYFGLPESVDYLLAGRARNALQRLNAVLGRLDIAALARLPSAGKADTGSAAAVPELAHGHFLKRTVLIGFTHFFSMFAYYSFGNWAATLAADVVASHAEGISVALMTHVGGIGGTILSGLVAQKFGLLRTTLFGLCGTGVAFALFGLVPGDVWLLGLSALLIGFTLFGTHVSLYSLFALSCPPGVRVSAIGAALSIGRVGSVLGPYMAGVLISYGASRGAVLLLLAVLQIFAAILLSRLGVSGNPEKQTRPAAISPVAQSGPSRPS